MANSPAWPANGLPPVDAAKMIAERFLWSEFETSGRLYAEVKPRRGFRIRSRGLDSDGRLRPVTIDPRLREREMRYKNAYAAINERFQKALIGGHVWAVGVLDGEECRRLIPPEMFVGRRVSLWFTSTEATRMEGGSRRTLYRAVRVFDDLETAQAYTEHRTATDARLKSFGLKVDGFVYSYLESCPNLLEEIRSGRCEDRGWLTRVVGEISEAYNGTEGKKPDRRQTEKAVRAFQNTHLASKTLAGKTHLQVAK